MNKITIIITAFKEALTVAKLVENIEKQIGVLFAKDRIKRSFEILLVCPDKETQKAGQAKDGLGILKLVKDKNQGKPAALNLGISKAQGKILVLSDGDVFWKPNALRHILIPFDQEKVGLVTGRPVTKNSRKTLFGFWSHLLTDAGAHQKRLSREKKGDYLDGSGYLMAVRKKLLSKLPKRVLADDAFISQRVWRQGYQIKYAPEAIVEVKYPDNWRDWLLQKRRSLGGYLQLEEFFKESPGRPLKEMRTFSNELKGIGQALDYPNSPKEYWWLILLVLARFYLWLAVFWDRKILKKKIIGPWARIESTK